MPKGIRLTTDQVREARRLKRRLWTHERIAARLGVSEWTICRALRKVERRALARLEREAAALKAAQVEQLAFVADEAAQEWERSKLDAEKMTIKSGHTPKGPINLEEQSSQGQTGDPRYLAEIRSALAEQRKILGLDRATEAGDSTTIGVDVIERAEAIRKERAERLRDLEATENEAAGPDAAGG